MARTNRADALGVSPLAPDDRETRELARAVEGRIGRRVDELGEERNEDGSFVLDHPDKARRLAAELGWGEQLTNRLVKRARANLRRGEAVGAPGSVAAGKAREFWGVGP